MSILIKNGRTIDPASGVDTRQDIYIEDGRIMQLGEDIQVDADRIIDASGKLVMPGFIDLHVHLRDPGFTYKETIETGVKAAAKGGFTTIFAMPNTKPVADQPGIIRYVEDAAARVMPLKVHQVGAVTMGQMGKELSDLEGMRQAGCIAISEDGKSVMDSGLYRKAMEYAAANDLLVMAHCEDINMVEKGVMNADENARALGLKGITNATEDVIVARDILLAKETGARLHLCHCSTYDSVRMVKEAKEAGIKVTAEVCPHHFTLTTDDIPGDDANFKMNPPLRTKKDVEALKAGLSDGTMDAISTDHAPHSAEEKQGSMNGAPFGIVGLETAAQLTWTELVEGELLTPMQMAERMSLAPARIAGIEGGSLAAGTCADIVILDTETDTVIDPDSFASKGKNTPFAGRVVRGTVQTTICSGEVIYEA